MRKNSMIKRTLIRKLDLFEFRDWLLSLGWKEEPRKLEHEVLRMRHDKWNISSGAPLLVYGNLNDEHLITFGVSRDVFKIFQRSKKEGSVLNLEKPVSPSFGLAAFISQKPIQFNDTTTRLAITKTPPGAPNLTGSRFGRFLVVGWSRDYKTSWVVKCDCGIYTTRRTKAITNHANSEDRCERCRRFAYAAKRMTR